MKPAKWNEENPERVQAARHLAAALAAEDEPVLAAWWLHQDNNDELGAMFNQVFRQNQSAVKPFKSHQSNDSF